MGIIRGHPELALFLCLAVGYLVGKLHVGPITLGGICGTLIVSLLLGTRHVSVGDDVKTIFFAIFIFALGYMAGPQFFANLNRRGLRYGVLSLIELVTVLVIAYVLAKAFDLDIGTASGILAGAATESAVVGTATEAIGKLSGLSAHQISEYQGHVATAYTVCYLFGLITIVLFTSQILPLLMHINLADASRELWARMRGDAPALESDEREALPSTVGRTYLVTHADGRTVGEIEAASGQRVTVERIKRGGKILTPAPELAAHPLRPPPRRGPPRGDHRGGAAHRARDRLRAGARLAARDAADLAHGQGDDRQDGRPAPARPPGVPAGRGVRHRCRTG